MPPQSHFTAFSDMKSKQFSNTLRVSSLHVISCIRQPVTHELDKIHVLYARKFVDQLRGLCLSAKSLLGSIERVLVYIRSV